MERVLTSRWFNPIALLLLTGVIVVVYSGTFDAPFQFDDQINILKNRGLHDLKNLWGILAGPRGITNATFALNYAVNGTSVTGYHVVNTAIHIINAILVYLLILSTLRLAHYRVGQARWAAFFTSALFALHPLQTQAVTYIVQRMESLSCLFYLLGMLLFIRAAGSKRAALRGLLYALIGLSYWAGFYSKESVLTLPAVVLLYDLFFFSGFKINGLIRKWPLYLLLSILFIIFSIRTVAPLAGIELFDRTEPVAETVKVERNTAETRVASPVTGGGVADSTKTTAKTKIAKNRGSITAGFGLTSISPRNYLYTQFNVITYYFTLLLWPANQNLDYDFPVSSSLFETPELRPGAILNIPLPPPILSLGFLVLIILAAFYLTLRSVRLEENVMSRAKVIAFFIFWFFIILSPTSSFVPIRDVIYEHRLYLPSVGFFLIAVLCLDMLLSQRYKSN